MIFNKLAILFREKSNFWLQASTLLSAMRDYFLRDFTFWLRISMFWNTFEFWQNLKKNFDFWFWPRLLIRIWIRFTKFRFKKFIFRKFRFTKFRFTKFRFTKFIFRKFIFRKFRFTKFRFTKFGFTKFRFSQY